MSPTKIVSKIYNSIRKSKGESTYYIKEKWERESKFMISEEKWDHICTIQWVSTGSNTWREFCWKNSVRFFITPAQKRHQGIDDACWRCGNERANHFHIFWNCQIIQKYWVEIHQHLQMVFSINFPFSFETIYLCNVEMDGFSFKEKKLLYILLAASKKAVTRKWLQPEQPEIEDWINIVQDIYKMEKLSAGLKLQLDSFYKTWSKWMKYVKPVRSGLQL